MVPSQKELVSLYTSRLEQLHNLFNHSFRLSVYLASIVLQPSYKRFSSSGKFSIMTFIIGVDDGGSVSKIASFS